MPYSVPLFGLCRLLPILGKNPLVGKTPSMYSSQVSLQFVYMLQASSYSYPLSTTRSIASIRKISLYFLSHLPLTAVPLLVVTAPDTRYGALSQSDWPL